MFALVVPCYVEGASLHQERGGATVIARFAFNELVSFIAGWAICLDYLILISICAFATTDYAAVFWDPLSSGVPGFLLAAGVVAAVTWRNLRRSGAPRYDRAVFLVLGDLVLQLLIVAFGLIYIFDPDVLSSPSSIGGTPSMKDLVFAFPLVLVAFSGLDASSGLAGQVAIGRQGLRRLIGVRLLAALVPYVGIAMVASTALPDEPSQSWVEAPMLGVVDDFTQSWLHDPLRYLVGDLGLRDPVRRLQRLDARRVAARLLARHQPPAPVARRLPAPGVGDAGRDHRHRRGGGDPAAADRRPRVPARHLGVRRHGCVHARLPVGLPAALPRAGPRPPVPDAVQRAHRRR